MSKRRATLYRLTRYRVKNVGVGIEVSQMGSHTTVSCCHAPVRGSGGFVSPLPHSTRILRLYERQRLGMTARKGDSFASPIVGRSVIGVTLMKENDRRCDLIRMLRGFGAVPGFFGSSGITKRSWKAAKTIPPFLRISTGLGSSTLTVNL